MRAGNLNQQVLLETLSSAAFGLLLLYLLRSGDYLNYVTPRLQPYLYFTAAVTLIWAAAGAARLRRPRRRPRLGHCYVLVVPILLFLLPHAPIASADISWSYAGGGALLSAPSPVSPAAGLALDAVSGEETYVPAADLPAAPPGADEADHSIVVDNDNFYPWLNELYSNMDKYAGWQIYLTGFVFKDPEVFLENEFMTARLGMTCCAADLVPYGLICQFSGAPALAPDSWVTVEGTIQAGEYNGWPEPQIIVTGITAAQEAPGYIYPFG
ncbi:MAG: TIGR03943 family protein [Gracilibacteraceae bacterium]|jgi:putative membrane protein|nr:TIGR03943 family protein [Gracilibacteraceae bacterium]